MKNIPKLIFRIMGLEENIDIIKWAYYEDNGLLSVHNYTINYFPELAKLDKNLSKEEIDKEIELVVKKDYIKYKDRLNEEVERYNNIWKEYNDIYFTKLSEFLEVDWPPTTKVIEATVGLIPVFPRYLDEFCFSISSGVEDWKLIETCAHEILHFLWFEKWRTIHPETPRREYDSPYLTWQYSEMVTDPILNNKPFNKLFNFKEQGYDSFYKMYDGDTLVMDKLREIYSRDIPINEKINTGFDYIKNYEQHRKRL